MEIHGTSVEKIKGTVDGYADRKQTEQQMKLHGNADRKIERTADGNAQKSRWNKRGNCRCVLK